MKSFCYFDIPYMIYSNYSYSFHMVSRSIMSQRILLFLILIFRFSQNPHSPARREVLRRGTGPCWPRRTSAGRPASGPWRSCGTARAPRSPELKGSIGEGPNHSNHSNSFKIGIFPRKFKNFRKFQHFLNYRRNSDKISSKSEQKSVKRIQK